MRTLQWIASLLFLAPVAGCILIAPDFEPKPHCPVAGTSSCATCIQRECQPLVDLCCGSDDCRSGVGNLDIGATMNAVDDCGRGELSTCIDELASASPSAEGPAVASCIGQNCANDCAPPASVGLKWSCSSPSPVTSACGSCITDQCQPAIQTCCGDASCSADAHFLVDMTFCMAGVVESCDAIEGESQTGSAGAVRTCIEKQCPACTTATSGTATTPRHCQGSLDQGWCSCDPGQPAGDDVQCTAGELAGECHTFKSSGGTDGDSCICGHWSCNPNFAANRCDCSFRSETVTDDTQKECDLDEVADALHPVGAQSVCCLTTEGVDIVCTCDIERAFCESPAGRQVDSCDEATIQRTLGVGVASCSQ